MRPLALLALLASPALADDRATVRTETVLGRPGLVVVNFSVTNRSSQTLGRVFVDCTFFGPDQKPVRTQPGLVQNVRPGETAHGSTALPVDPKAVPTAACRLSSVSE